MQAMVETQVLSMCMALHFNLPPFTALGKGTRRCGGTPPGCLCIFGFALKAECFTANKCTRTS